MGLKPTLNELAVALASGRSTSRALVEACLGQIDDKAGEGARAFIHVNRTEARAAADAIDKLRAAGMAPSPWAGIPISIKDLFDVQGEVTRAGSKALADRAPAAADAPAVARLKAAGFIVIGRSNMTEFAFSGVGLNPHYGTPKGAWDRASGRIPGGSSSGAAVSVADGMAHVGLGTDTGGSCRIPAAFNGLVGYKPTASRVPTAGAIPLSTTLDSIGPIARSVACCAAVDAVLAGEAPRALVAVPARRVRIAVPRQFMLTAMDDQVTNAFERALGKLTAAGVDVQRIDIPELDDVPRINAKGGFSAPEALAWHRQLIAAKGAMYDPRVLVRINRGNEQTGVDFVELLAARRALIAGVEARLSDFDAMATPTAPFVPPRIEELAKEDDYTRINMRALRNPTVINMLDGCAISLPMQAAGEPPMGLMLAARTGQDHALFRLAATVEAVVSP